MRLALTLLQLVEAGNAKGLSFKAPGAGFHDLFGAGLASDTIHDAGVAGDLPLWLFQFEKLIQRNVEDLS